MVQGALNDSGKTTFTDVIASAGPSASSAGPSASTRRAVNALLDADNSDAARCEIRELYRPQERELALTR